ncbi:hypothetical protein KR054_009406, partial [Drosophila jambulina]
MPTRCRTCGQGAEYSRSLFDEESADILHNILKLTGILLTKEVGVPSRICVSCLLDLKEAIAFRERCIRTNNLWFEEQNNNDEELDTASTEAELEVLSRLSVQGSKREYGIASKTTDELIHPLSTQDEVPAEVLDPLISEETIKLEEESLHSDAELGGSDDQEIEEITPPPETRKKRGRPPKMQKKSTSEKKATRNKSARAKRIYAKKEGLYFCDQCGKSFSEKGNFNIHLTRHTGVKQFECEECGRKEFSQHLLNLHVRVKHRGELPYVCKYCGQRFGNCNLRLRHERNHNPRPRQYKCPICDKGFQEKKTLQNHATVHTGEHPFHCELCQTYFGRKTSLRTHLRSLRHRKNAEEQKKNPEDDDLHTVPKTS